ncbi:MAG TPA: cytochrome c oxidase subunit 3 [Nocardioides sp.]|nr:cytochrome c oxidase subunit 3 [Nocardioides sp.]
MTATAPGPDDVMHGQSRERRLPGDVDMWVMILGDLFFFGCYFVTYMVFRALNLTEFSAAQQHLSVGTGVLNTVVLLTSSLFAALAVIAVREGALAAAQRHLLAAAGCGVVFILVKAYEWHTELSAGHTVSEEFFGFYFVLTGVHLVHVVFGLICLGVAVRGLRSAERPRPEHTEQAALFWHMVDLLWVVIFAMLYLMR